MSDPDREPSSDGSSTDLDVTSPQFKPLRALYSERTQIPVPEAKPLDNVTTFEARFRMLGGFGERYNEQRIREIRQEAAKAKNPVVLPGEAPVRRFLPHQEMVQGFRPARSTRNIFTKIENFEGPLGELRTWMRERVRVKVYTRKEKGVRGIVTGFVEVFDKHWNLALSDVFESWKRRKYRYSENKLPKLGQEPQDCSELLRNMGISVPEVTVKSVDRKYVQCSRHVPKLIVRGEQVVLVTPERGAEVTEEKKETVVVKKEEEISIKKESLKN